uniref:Uncharacterized protein n=1 Tax=Panagrolaimus davidi TaxID=227884 RepID=A0A914P3N4_9BILA
MITFFCLKRKIEAKEFEIGNLEAQVTALPAQTPTADAEVQTDEANRDLNAMPTGEIESLREKLKQNVDLNETLERDLESNVKALEVANEKTEQLLQTVAEAKTRLAEKEDAIAKLQADLENAQTLVDNADAEVGDWKHKHADATYAFEQAQAELDKKVAELKGANQKLEELETEAAKWRGNALSAEEDYAQVEDELKEAREQIKNLQTRLIAPQPPPTGSSPPAASHQTAQDQIVETAEVQINQDQPDEADNEEQDQHVQLDDQDQSDDGEQSPPTASQSSKRRRVRRAKKPKPALVPIEIQETKLAGVFDEDIRRLTADEIEARRAVRRTFSKGDSCCNRSRGVHHSCWNMDKCRVKQDAKGKNDFEDIGAKMKNSPWFCRTCSDAAYRKQFEENDKKLLPAASSSSQAAPSSSQAE